MAYTIDKKNVIDYPPEHLREFHVYGFEWIDNLHFIEPPEIFISSFGMQLADYLTIVRERFLQAGWHRDGEIGLLWLPPFVFPLSLKIPTVGIVLWHVKQEEDGISWLLSPIELPFEEFQS
jgi:hypothetical protein